MEREKTESRHLLFVIPILGDWESLQILLLLINGELSRLKLEASVLVVNDRLEDDLPRFELEQIKNKLNSIKNLFILRLNHNVGNQRAIAISLSYIENEIDFGVNFDAVILMDGDGEDDVYDLEKLTKAYFENDRKQIIFARRVKRSEGLKFIIFYECYKRFFFFLTKCKIERGNYSIIPKSKLRGLVSLSDLWIHFPVSLIKARIEVIDIDTNRAKRFRGKPNSNLIFLILHGLNALAVYSEQVSLRLFIILFLFSMLFLTAFISLNFPLKTILFLLFLILQIQALFFILLLYHLKNKSLSQNIPRMTYKSYINTLERF